MFSAPAKEVVEVCARTRLLPIIINAMVPTNAAATATPTNTKKAVSSSFPALGEGVGVGACPRRAAWGDCAAVEGRQPIVSHNSGTMEGGDALAKTMAPKNMAAVLLEA